MHLAESGEIHMQACYALFLLVRVTHSTLSLCKKKYICTYAMCLPREGYLWLTSGFSLGQTTDTPMPNKILNSKREKGRVLTIRKKAIAPYSSTLAWKTPWMEEPGRLQSMGSRRVGHDWTTSLFTFMHWRKKWQPTPVFLSGESQGWWSLVGCRLWGHTESDTTEAT